MKSPMVRFTVLFFVFLLGFSVLSVATTLQNHLRVAETATAAAATRLAHVAGSAATLSGNTISVSGMTLEINHECTGVFVLFVLASFIAAYPSRLSSKAIGLAVGVLLLSFINIIRIATLVRLVESYPSLFAYFHEYVWQGAFLMLMTLYAMGWVERARQ